MEQDVTIIPGPPSDKIKKAEAVAKLKAHPEFPKNASFSVENVEGRWVAAVSVPKNKRVSAPPFEGPPSPDGPPMPSEVTDAPPSLDAPSEDAPGDKPKGEDGEKGLEHLIHELLDKMTTITEALGLGDHADSPVPGADELHGPPEGDSPAGPPTDGEGKTHTVHERAMKPGESPPGSTPIGSPAFASVADDHPWKDVIGQKKTFVVEDEIGDTPISEVYKEITALAAGTGYKVERLREGTNQAGQRIASALLQDKSAA